MILVVAPEGWVAPQNSASEIAPVDNTVGSGKNDDGEFSDIDNILKQNQGAAPKSGHRKVKGSKPRPKQQNRPTTKQNQTKSTVAKSAESNPILPNEDWIAGTTQRKRRNLLLGIGAVGLLALITIAVLLFVSNRADQSPQVVENNDGRDISNSTDGSDSIVSETPNLPEPERKEQPAVKPEPNAPESAEPVTTPPESATKLESEETPADTAAVEQPGDEAGRKENPNDPPSETKSIPSPFRKGLDDILDQSTIQTPVSSDSLSDLLEDSGSSITDLNQEVSALANRRHIGLPKYYIKKPSALDERTLQKLNDPIGIVQYNKQSLLTIIAELSQITGVPISFDCDQLRSIEFDFGSEVGSFQLKETDFRTALEQVLHGLDRRLGIQYDGNSPATIVMSDFAKIDAATFEPPASTSRTPEQFVDLIRQLIEPATWSKEQCSIGLENQQLAISNSLFVRQRIADFLDKWSSIASARTTGSWPDSIRSKTKAFAETRELPHHFKHKYNLPCSVYLAKVQKSAGANVVIDFNETLALGWNQNTQLPSDIDESTVGDLVDELAHSMNVAGRIIDQNTIELTSQTAMESKTELEFYDCSKILAGRITSENLTALVRETLQNISSDNLRIYLDEEIQSLIVIGPQPVQQQIEALLDRLVELNSN